MPLQNVKPPVIEIGGKRFDTAAPAVGDTLVFNGSLWVPGTPHADNILWQGGMQVWQGGTSFTGLGGQETFIADGWKFGRDNFATGKLTIAQDANSQAPPGKSILMQCTTAEPSWTSSAIATVSARIEGQDLARLGYGMVGSLQSTISFWAYSSSAAAGTYTLYIWYQDASSANNKAYKTTFTLASGWQYITKLIPPGPMLVGNDFYIRAICGICLAAGTNLVDSQADTWHTPDATFKAGLTGQKNFFDNTSNRIDIASFQWTPGPVARPYIHKTFSECLAKAQRYFEKSFDYTTAPAQNVGYSNGAVNFVQVVGASTSQYGAFIPYKVPKRYPPVVTFFNPSAANLQARNISAGADCSATTTWAASEAGFMIGLQTAPGSIAGNANAVHWTADIRG